jgi:hypothetical protein
MAFCSAVIAAWHDAREGSNTYQIEPSNSCASMSLAVHSPRMRCVCDAYEAPITATDSAERFAIESGRIARSVYV